MIQDIKIRRVNLKDIYVTDPLLKKEMDLVRDTVIPYQWAALNDQIQIGRAHV